MTGDMHQTIVPKSDQLNSDDLIGRELTITITGVTIRGGQEQPVSISYAGDEGKPYKACKSMCRVMVHIWGADSKQYVGRSMTLYRDPKVKWGGMEVGGIRISHMSDITEPVTMALTATKGSRKLFTVQPLVKKAEEQIAYITADQALQLESMIDENGLDKAAFLKKHNLLKFSYIQAADFESAKRVIEKAIARKSVPPLEP